MIIEIVFVLFIIQIFGLELENVSGGVESVCVVDYKKLYGCNNLGVAYSIADLDETQTWVLGPPISDCMEISCSSDESIFYLNETNDWKIWDSGEIFIASNFSWVSSSRGFKKGCAVDSNGDLYVFDENDGNHSRYSYDIDFIQCKQDDDSEITLGVQDDNHLYVYFGSKLVYWPISDYVDIKYLDVCTKSGQKWFLSIGLDEKMYAIPWYPVYNPEWKEIVLTGVTSSTYGGLSVSSDCSVALVSDIGESGGKNILYGRLFTWNCSDFESSDPRACSGHGICVSTAQCECFLGYSGTGGPDCFEEGYSQGKLLVVEDRFGRNEVEDYSHQGNWSSVSKPGGREGMCLFYNSFAEEEDILFVYGGRNTLFYSDIWQYSLSRKQWKYIKGGKNLGERLVSMDFDPENLPTQRIGAQCFSSLTEDLIYLYGGYTGLSMNDLWVFNITSNEFKKLKNETSSAKYGIKGVFNSSVLPYPWQSHHNGPGLMNETRYLGFGGNDDTGHYADTWEYDIPSNMWRHLHGPGYGEYQGSYDVKKNDWSDSDLAPHARSSAFQWVVPAEDNYFLYIFGGYAVAYIHDLKLWAFDYNLRRWAFVAGGYSDSMDKQFVASGYGYHSNNYPSSDTPQNGASWKMGNYLYMLNNFGVWTFHTVSREWKVSYLSNDRYNPCPNYTTGSENFGDRRARSAVVLNNRKAYVFGGGVGYPGNVGAACDVVNPYLQDIWSYDGFDCNKTARTDPAVCSGHGNCVGPDYCECYDGFWGDLCEGTICFGSFSNETDTVCSGHGICVSNNTCECDEKWNVTTQCSTCTYGFGGDDCEFNICYGVLSNDTETVCSGHGECIAHDTCQCDFSGYIGTRDCYYGEIIEDDEFPTKLEVDLGVPFSYDIMIDSVFIEHNNPNSEALGKYDFRDVNDEFLLIDVEESASYSITNLSPRFVRDEDTLSENGIAGVVDMFVIYPFLYVVGGNMAVYDISNMSNPNTVDLFIGASMSKIIVEDDLSLAYVSGYNTELYVMDINPFNLTKIGGISQTDADDLSKDGNYVYVGSYSQGVQIFDVSDPTSPTHVTYITHPGPDAARDVKVRDGIGFVANGGNIYSFNSSDIQNIQVFSVGQPATTNSIRINWKDDFIYVCDHGGSTALEIFDVSVFQSISFVDEYGVDNAHMTSFGGFKNNYIFVTGTMNENVGLDVTDPQNARVLYDFTSTPSNSIFVRNNYIFMGKVNYFKIYDFGSIRVEGTISDYRDCYIPINVTVKTNYGDYKNIIIDPIQIRPGLSNLVDCKNQVFRCDSVFSNDTDNIICGGHGNCTITNDDYYGLCECDNENWNVSSYCSKCNDGFGGDDCEFKICYGVLSNDTETVCSGHGECIAPDTCECDFSDFINTRDCYFGEIKEKETLILDVQLNDPFSYDISIGNFYVEHNNPNSEATSKYDLQDVNDEFFLIEIEESKVPYFANITKLNMEFLNSHSTVGEKVWEIYNMIVNLPYLYVHTGSFAIYNVSDVSNVTVVSNMEDFGTTLSISEDFHYAYMINGHDGQLSVLDISDPSNPFVLGNVSMGTAADVSQIDGDYLYVARHSSGIYVFDVSNPNIPFLKKIITHPTYNLARDVTVRDGIGFVANGDNIYSFDATDIDNVQVYSLGQPSSTYPIRVDRKDDYIFVGDYEESKLNIYDVSNIQSISYQTFYPVPNIHSICLGGYKGKYVFATGYLFTKIIVLNIMDPTSPELLHELNNCNKAESVKTQNNYIFLGRKDATISIYQYGSYQLYGEYSVNQVGDYTYSIDPDICEDKHFDYRVKTNYEDFKNFTITLRMNTSNTNIVDCKNNIFKCNSTFSNDSINVCNGHGNCSFTIYDSSGICECEPRWEGNFCDECAVGYFGDSCQFEDCFGIMINDSNVCSGHGNCTGANRCNCSSGYHSEECETWYCNGTQNDDSENVCSEHGNCTSSEICDCEANYYSNWCDVYECYGVLVNDTSKDVCDGHGDCVGFNDCDCFSDVYESENCDSFTCHGVDNSLYSEVCSGHGDCVDFDLCVCSNNYTYYDCRNWKCGDYWNNQSRSVCSSHGYCVGYDDCDCLSDLYTGDLCQYWTCFGEESHRIDTVCGGHGSCVSVDFCACQSGYFPSSDVLGEACDMWKCGDHKKNTKNACNGRGNCTLSETCECVDDYEGDECETWSCRGIDQSLRSVCSSNGKCIEPNKCKCRGQYVGEDCATNSFLYIIMAPTLGIFLIFVAVCLCFTTIICVCCVCIFSFFVILGLVSLLFGQRKKMLKFGKLKDFDLLLKEQEADQDTSVAHIRVDNKLFEVDYDSLKIEKILGEGGSESTVYKANWRGQDVAFKCFKTRTICSSQDKFDEFEKEVQIFSSISHPNIVRFFGCTMKPPRVGIVMEFCENGEMLDFILDYRENKGTGYPIENKIRMIHEIAIGMEYLHFRKIIHRDLKCENVLIDRNESCKLMDFGLSKIAARMSQVKTKRVGTSYYMAPEVVTASKYTEKCDVFSFAILCFLVITEMNNPYGLDDYGIEFKVANNARFRPDINKVEEYLKKCVGGDTFLWIGGVITRAWEHDHNKRSSFKELNEMFQNKSSVEDLSTVLSYPSGSFMEDKTKKIGDDDEKITSITIEEGKTETTEEYNLNTEEKLKIAEKKLKVTEGENMNLRKQMEMMVKELEYFRLFHEIKEEKNVRRLEGGININDNVGLLEIEIDSKSEDEDKDSTTTEEEKEDKEGSNEEDSSDDDE